MKKPTIGVLAIQGAIEEHIAMTKLAFNKMNVDGEVIQVKKTNDLEKINGLIIPGGESTTIGRVASINQLLQLIKQRILEGMPVLGTCAGLILLARETYDRVVGKIEQPTIGVLDVVVERNAFGRQRESFEAEIEIPIIGKEKFKGVFIRAPAIRKIGPNVEVLCKLRETIVGVMQGNIIATAFHPELTNDSRIHQLLIEKVRLL